MEVHTAADFYSVRNACATILIASAVLVLLFRKQNIILMMIQSPSAIVSQAIANVLADWFVVNPHDVQTSLFQYAGLVLQNLELQPFDNIRLNDTTTATITGRVGSVSFQWKWGGDSQRTNGSSFVHSAQLVLDGLEFQVILLSDKTSETSSSCENLDSSSFTSPSFSAGEKYRDSCNQENEPVAAEPVPVGFIQDQVNRIVDALGVKVSNVRITIRTSDSLLDSKESASSAAYLVVGADGLTLESLGRLKPSDGLVQELMLQGLFANVVVCQEMSATVAAKTDIVKTESTSESKQDDTTASLFLLEPVSYKATCTRAKGMPLGAQLLQQGLEVIGSSADQGVVVHAGLEQLQCLNELGTYLLADSGKSQPTISPPAPNTPTISMDDSEPVTDSIGSALSQSLDSNVNVSSVKLPLSAISLVLPNNTKIALTGLILDYCLDGSRCVVTGQHGISIDDFSLLALSPSSIWSADLVECQFRVYSTTTSAENPTTTDTVAAKIQARSKELDGIKEGAQQLLAIVHAMSAQESGVLKSMTENAAVSQPIEPATTTPESTSRAWSAAIESLECVVQGDDDMPLVECLLHNVRALANKRTLSIGSIERFRVPNTIHLLQPVRDTVLAYDGNLLDLSINEVVAALEEPDASQIPVDDAEEMRLATLEKQGVPALSDETVDDGTVVLPFGVHALLKSATIYKTDGKSLHTSAKALRFAAGPDLSGDQHLTGAIRVLVMLEELNHDMLSLNHAKISAIVHPNNLDRVDKLEFDARLMAIAAGYSVFEWKRLFETGDEKREPKKKTKKTKGGTPMCLPFAHINELKIKVAVKATLVSTQDTTLHMAEFRGNERTTLNDLVIWYTQRVLANAPGVVTNASVLGFNVSDTAANYSGTVMLSSAFGALGSAAAPVAGVLGMVGLDAVKNTINAGKRGRGVEDDDKRQLGDFVRGLGQLAKEAAQGGAVARGKSQDEQADALDWALGATGDVAKYADENKARLGGAGAGAVGFGYGLLLGGPVGAIAGALITSHAASNTITAVDRRLRGTKEDSTK